MELPIKFKKGIIIRLGPKGRAEERYTFQFNPSTIKDSRAVDYGVTKAIQSEQPRYSHLHAGERVIKFQLFLNGLEPDGGFSTSQGTLFRQQNRLQSSNSRSNAGAESTQVKIFPFAEDTETDNKYLEPTGAKNATSAPLIPVRNVQNDMDLLEELRHGDGKNPPPELLFVWKGYSNSRWFLSKLAFNTTMWDKNLWPLHVTVDIEMKESARTLNTVRESNGIFR